MLLRSRACWDSSSPAGVGNSPLRFTPLRSRFCCSQCCFRYVALLARSEAWNVCVRAAGGTVTRRLLFRAAGVGYLASLVNGSVGMAARIASLRRVAPQTAPRVPALLAAEVPIITVEVALAAIFSFTLIAPLGVPWWVPVIAVAITGGVRRRCCAGFPSAIEPDCGRAWRWCATRVAVA